MPRVIGLKKYTHTLLVLSTLILFLKSSRLKSYVVVGGWQNRKTKVSKQSMMKQGGYHLKKTNFIFTKSRVRSLRRSWDEINTHYKLSALLGHCKNILPNPSPKNDFFFDNWFQILCCFETFCPFSVRDWHWCDDSFHPYFNIFATFLRFFFSVTNYHILVKVKYNPLEIKLELNNEVAPFSY